MVQKEIAEGGGKGGVFRKGRARHLLWTRDGGGEQRTNRGVFLIGRKGFKSGERKVRESRRGGKKEPPSWSRKEERFKLAP